MKSLRFSYPLAFGLLLMWLATGSSCFYDNEEDLYPVQPGLVDCDTTEVSYQDFVAPLMEQYCTGCHGGNFPSANLSLETHAEVINSQEDNSLFGSMAHLEGFSKMPKGGNRLPDCDLDKLQAWIEEGAPNN